MSSRQKPGQNRPITSDNLWPTGNVTDISPSSIGRLVVFGDLVWLLVHSLILGGASRLGFLGWIRSAADGFEAGLHWLSCAKIGWSDDYSPFCHGGLMTSNHRFELMPSPAEPIELLLAGSLIFVLFQALAHLRSVCYYEPIISPRNQLF